MVLPSRLTHWRIEAVFPEGHTFTTAMLLGADDVLRRQTSLRYQTFYRLKRTGTWITTWGGGDYDAAFLAIPFGPGIDYEAELSRLGPYGAALGAVAMRPSVAPESIEAHEASLRDLVARRPDPCAIVVHLPKKENFWSARVQKIIAHREPYALRACPRTDDASAVVIHFDIPTTEHPRHCYEQAIELAKELSPTFEIDRSGFEAAVRALEAAGVEPGDPAALALYGDSLDLYPPAEKRHWAIFVEPGSTNPIAFVREVARRRWVRSSEAEGPVDAAVVFIDLQEEKDLSAALGRIRGPRTPECSVEVASERQGRLRAKDEVSDAVAIWVRGPRGIAFPVAEWWSAMEEAGLVLGDGDMFYGCDDDGDAFMAEPFLAGQLRYFHAGDLNGPVRFDAVRLSVIVGEGADLERRLKAMHRCAKHIAGKLGARVTNARGRPHRLATIRTWLRRWL